MKLSDIQLDKRALIIGDSGTGKTRLCGTLAQLIPTVIVTSDIRGLDTLVTMGVEPEVIPITDWAKPWQYYGQISKAAQNGVRALALDNFGSLQGVAEREILSRPRGRSEENEENKNPGQRAEAVRAEMLEGRRRLELRQWGSMNVALDSLLHELFALKFGIVLVTVLEEIREHPRTAQDRIYPAVQGGMRYELAAEFSLVGNTFIDFGEDGKERFCLTTRPHPRISTKTCYGEPRTWVSPTAERLLKHMNRADDPETPDEKKVGVGIQQQTKRSNT